jgi:peptidoglycan/LPS O-acetylase OafA/YrhL
LPTYRSDIDGLRAFAVLFVLAYHAFPKQFPAGFVGVDIFFVISGFLISRIIFDALQDKSFSFLQFYARRVRRIFPALAVVLTVSVIVGWFIMLQDEYRELGGDLSAAAIFVANFAFLRDAGYFGPAASELPLLHLWSLGIEEQYYLIWPLLVVLSWRWRRGPLLLAVAVLAVSFTDNIMLVQTNQAAAFYLPLPRFWELMIGSGLAFLSRQMGMVDRQGAFHLKAALDRFPRHASIAHELAAWSGLALIVAGLILIDRDRPFPGWWALLPTLGTAALIAAGPSALINRLVLGQPALVYVGLISYPLYLWHWPLLVFERLVRFDEPTDLMKAGALGAAFLLSDQTWRWIEKPIRFGDGSWRKTVIAALALGASGSLGVLVYAGEGFPQRLPEEVRALARTGGMGANAVTASHIDKCFPLNDDPMFKSECDGSHTTARRVVLWGDSYASHLYFGLLKLQQARGDFDLAEYTAAGCPPVIAYDGEASCTAINQRVVRKLRELTPDTVILSGRWELYAHEGQGKVTGEKIHATVEELFEIGVRRVVVMGEFPVWQDSVPRLRAAQLGALSRRFAGAGKNADRAFPQMFQTELSSDAMVRQALAGTGASSSRRWRPSATQADVSLWYRNVTNRSLPMPDTFRLQLRSSLSTQTRMRCWGIERSSWTGPAKGCRAALPCSPNHVVWASAAGANRTDEPAGPYRIRQRQPPSCRGRVARREPVAPEVDW